MFRKFSSIVQRWIRSRDAKSNARQLLSNSFENGIVDTHNIVDIDVKVLKDPEKIELLNRSRIHWQLGEWDKLAALDANDFYSKQDRAEATQLLMAAMFQTGNIARGQELFSLAKKYEDGASNTCQILICGVYNNLARARFLIGNKSVSLQHFKKSVDRITFPLNSWSIIESRIQTQQRQINLLLRRTSEKKFEEVPESVKERYSEFRSAEYWEKRYRNGETSGFGSYGRLAEFKAKVVNRFVDEKNVSKLIEFGCGDGHQLEKIIIPEYVGIDVSPTIIQHCRRVFENDNSKRFLTIDEFNANREKAELTLSLDVIFHLVEDQVFEEYMKNLLDSSERYCIIYSCDGRDSSTNAQHVRQRMFTSWVTLERPEWNLTDVIKNEFPHDGTRNPKDTSFSDFYIYEKC